MQRELYMNQRLTNSRENDLLKQYFTNKYIFIILNKSIVINLCNFSIDQSRSLALRVT